MPLRPAAWAVLAIGADADVLEPLRAAGARVEVVPAGATALAAAAASARAGATLVFVGAGAEKDGSLAALTPALLEAAAAAAAAAPRVDARVLSGLASHAAAAATRGSAPHALYWPADGGRVPAAAARVHARALAAALADAATALPEAAAVALAALAAHSPEPLPPATSPRITVKLPGRAGTPPLRVGVGALAAPTLLSAFAPALPSLDTVPLPHTDDADLAKLGAPGAVPGWARTRVLAPHAEVALSLARPLARPAAVAALVHGVRAALVAVARGVTIASTACVAPPPAGAGGAAALACATATGIVTLTGSASVLARPALLELALRQGLVADALALQAKGQEGGGERPTLTAVTSLWCAATLRAAPGPLGGVLAGLGVAAVDGVPLRGAAAAAADFAALARSPPAAPPRASAPAPGAAPAPAEFVALASARVPGRRGGTGGGADGAPPPLTLNGHPLTAAALASAVDAAGGADAMRGDPAAWAAAVLPRVAGAGAVARQAAAEGAALRDEHARLTGGMAVD